MSSTPAVAQQRDLLDDCVHCGFCLPTCPTYVLWGQETDSPRGRIHLMKLRRDGRETNSDSFVRHIDTCLGCMACVTACPSGVQYDSLLEAARPEVERVAERSLSERAFRAMIFALFPKPERLRRLAGPLGLYQRLGIRRWFHQSGLAGALPRRLRALEQLLPPIPEAHEGLPAFVAAEGQARRRVGMLLGCVQRVFFPSVNAATVRVLAAEGCDVVIPPEQGCCGALAEHAGEEERAIESAKATIDAFEAAGVDTVAINAAGCGSAMKRYGHLLRNDAEYAERARAFSTKCRDVTELLAELEPRAPRHPVSMRIAYHDACHLQHAQGIRAQPRRLLQAIPGVELHEIAESEICCGSAGIYNLVEPEAAAALRDRKVQHILKTGADVVVSGNPGCLLQLATGLEAAGHPKRILHSVELLDRSIRGSDA